MLIDRLLFSVGTLLTLTFLTISTSVNNPNNALIVHSVYGDTLVDSPLVVEILKSKALQRLKGIHQYGVLRYAAPVEEYSRYDHSVGVFVLLNRFGCSVDEQIAGLTHDVSHTAFSHLGDYVFDHPHLENSYRQDIHN